MNPEAVAPFTVFFVFPLMFFLVVGFFAVPENIEVAKKELQKLSLRGWILLSIIFFPITLYVILYKVIVWVCKNCIVPGFKWLFLKDDLY